MRLLPPAFFYVCLKLPLAIRDKDLVVRTYHETYGLPVNITRCSNNYGPYQFHEKLIPLMIHSARTDKPLPVCGDGMQIRDSRTTALPLRRS